MVICASLIQRPASPATCRRLYDETLKILYKDVDPSVPVNPTAGQISASMPNTGTATNSTRDTMPHSPTGAGAFFGGGLIGGNGAGAGGGMRDVAAHGADKAVRAQEKPLPNSHGILGGTPVKGVGA